MKFNSTAFFNFYLKENIFLGDCEDISANRTLLKNSHISKTSKANPTLPLVPVNTLFFVYLVSFIYVHVVLLFKVLLIQRSSML